MPAELKALQSQRMVLSQQLKQSIELLQLPTSELLAEISRELEENPLLEIPEGAESPLEKGDSEHPAPQAAPALLSRQEDTEEESLASQERSAARENEIDLVSQSWGAPEGDEDFSPIDNAASRTTLADHLMEELGLAKAPPKILEKAAFLIGELNDDGFLTVTLEEAAKDFQQFTRSAPAPASKWQEALRVLQGLGPAGIGAASPQEALALQLDEIIAENAGLPEARIASLAKRVIAESLTDLARKDFTKLRRQLSCSEAEIEAVNACILSLSPRPASQYKTEPTLYVEPDVFVTFSNGCWSAKLNPATAPEIRVNPQLAELLREHRSERSKAMAEHLADARAFAHSIAQRYDTILRVARSIVSRQQAFFSEGEIALVPMVMKDIADDTGLHESTVSRAVNGKYLQSPRGMFEFRHFFSSSLASAAGEAVSSKAIKAIIRELVSQEPPAKPLSDAKIAELLAERGYPLARRTVAKYREQEGVPAASLRKRR